MRSLTVPIIKGVPGIEGKKVAIFKTKTPKLLKFQAGLSLTQKKSVANVEWEHQEGRSAGKAAVGAIGGGILAGPLGLIAGAAIGGKKKDQSTAVITFEDGGQLHVRLTANEYEGILKMLS
jgi:hypothetical protein